MISSVRVLGATAVLLCLLLTMPAVVQAQVASANADDRPVRSKINWQQGEIIVKFKDHALTPPQGTEGLHEIVPSRKTQLLNESQCTVVDAMPVSQGEITRLRVPNDRSTQQMLNIYANDPAVEYAELNPLVTASFVPDDANYSLQWNFNNPVTGGINIEGAWEIQQGDPNVIVAVLDTGVAYEDYSVFKQAPDLAQTNFVPGWDFIGNDAHANDDNGHGTHVTGTIAQSTNNGYALAGVAFKTSIMPVKVLDGYGSGTHYTVASGIRFAADNGAKIINMSLGSQQATETLRQAVEYAYSKGCAIICAAGNDCMRGNFKNYPAAYDDYCIAVGATRFDNTHAPYSNTGEYVDIVAPGGDVNMDQNQDGNPDGVCQQTISETNYTTFTLRFMDGTSMATPHVSGVAALLAANGITDPEQIREALLNTARYIPDPEAGQEWSEWYGHGLLDAYAALNYVFPIIYEGDLNDDLIVDTGDLLIMVDQWLRPDPNEVYATFLAENGPYDPNDPNTWFDPNDFGLVYDANEPSADFNLDELVNLQDLEVLHRDWLKPQPE